ncbi:hypothetical protein U1Q18_011092 [Sarracenia purpurea var. burkii]
MASPEDVSRPLKQRIREMDSMGPRAKEAEPKSHVGLANQANGGPNDPGPGTDLISGEVAPYPKQTNWDEGSSRATRARNWKRRVREVNEQQSIPSGKGDDGKRRAEGRGWDDISDAEEGTKKRQRFEEALKGSFDYSEVETNEGHVWNALADAQEGPKRRQSFEDSHDGMYVDYDTAVADTQPRRTP